jgi:transposase
MAAPREYRVELGERAARVVVDGCKDSATRSGALVRIGGQLGINLEMRRRRAVRVTA